MTNMYWKWYQERIAELFSKVRDVISEPDVRERGRISGVMRQLDIRIKIPFSIDLGRGFSVSIPIKIIVDCKAHKTALDVKEIGEIIELKEDVDANLAVVVSPEGVSPGALERAKAGGVFPITVTGDLIALMYRLELPETPCRICEKGCVCWKGELEGHCDYCNGLHLRCPDCLEVIGVPDAQYDIGVQCGAQCGTVFLVHHNPKEYSYDVKVFDSLNTVLMKAALQKPTGRLTKGEVDRIIGKTKWQHWDVASPTIDLTEEGLMEWRKGGFLYITPEGKKIVRDIILQAEPAYFY